MSKLKNKKYIALIGIIVLIVGIIGLFTFGRVDKYKGLIKVKNVVSDTKALSASVSNLVDNETTSKGSDEIKYEISYSLDNIAGVETRDVIIKGQLSASESKYARFKKVTGNNITSTLTDDGKEIEVEVNDVRLGVDNKITLKLVITNAPNGFKVNPNIVIKEETGEETTVNTNEVEVSTRVIEGIVKDEKGLPVGNIELSLNKDGREIKRTYTDENGNYIFSDIEDGTYEIKVEEEIYQSTNRNIITNDGKLNINIKEVTPYEIEAHKYITKLNLIVNGEKQEYTYKDLETVVQVVKNAKTISGDITYKITIKNIGEKTGTLSMLKDKVDNGLSIDQKKNTGWKEKEGNLYYELIEGAKISKNETKEIALKLDIKDTNQIKTYINQIDANGETYERVVYILDGVKYREENVILGETIEELKINDDRFDGWYTDKNYTNKYNFKNEVTKDLILYGKTDIITHKVEFYDKDPSDGTETKWYEQDVEDGKKVKEPEEPEHRGYSFECWMDEHDNIWNFDNPVERDLRLTSCYSLNRYSIVYNNLTQQELQDLDNPTSYTVEDTITIRNANDRYDEDNLLSERFIGWTGSNGNTPSTNITFSSEIGNKEYTANFEQVDPDEYIITYVLNGGALEEGVTNPTKYTKKTPTFTLNNPSKDHYRFIGWTGSNGDVLELEVTMVKGENEGDKEFIANYELITHKVTFKDYDPENPENTLVNFIDPVDVPDGDPVNKPQDDPEHTGYICDKWSTKINGNYNEDAYNFNTPVTNDLTLYTLCKKREYVVTYMDGDTQYARDTVLYKEKATRPSTDPTKAHNIFLGWTLDNTLYNFNTLVTDNITLYSSYEEVLPPVITHTPTEWTNQNVDVTVSPNAELVDTTGYTYKYRIENGQYRDYSSPYVIEENCNVHAVAYKSGVASQEVDHIIDNIDKIKPTITNVSASQITTNNFVLNISGYDHESGLHDFKIYKDDEYVTTVNYNGEVSTQSTTYTFNNLDAGTVYRIKVIAKDVAANTSEAVEIDVETTQEQRIVAQIIAYAGSPLLEYIPLPTLYAGITYNQDGINCNTTQCTIQMLDNVTETNNILEGQDITLDLNGYNIVGLNDYTFNNNGEFTVIDSSEESSSTDLINSYVQDGILVNLDGKNPGTTDQVWEGINSSYNGNIHGSTWSDTEFGLNFDGTDDYVSIDEINPSYLTLETTFETNKYQSEFVVGNYETGGYGVYINASKQLVAGVYVSGSYREIKINNAELNTKYNIALTYDGYTVKMYINGMLRGSLPVSSEITPITSARNNTYLMLGTNPVRNQAYNQYFSGTIYSARVYDRALTQDEIINNYQLDRKRFISKIDYEKEISEDSNGIINNTDTAIINTGILTLGEGTSGNDVSTVKPFVSGLNKGVSTTGTFNFYDGRITGEVAIDGMVDDTPVFHNASVEVLSDGGDVLQVATLQRIIDAEARINGTYYTRVANAVEDAKLNAKVDKEAEVDLQREGGLETVSGSDFLFGKARRDSSVNYDYYYSTNRDIGSSSTAGFKLLLQDYENDQELYIKTRNYQLGTAGAEPLATARVTIYENDINGAVVAQEDLTGTAREYLETTILLEKGKNYFVTFTYDYPEVTNRNDMVFEIHKMTLRDNIIYNNVVEKNSIRDFTLTSDYTNYSFEYDANEQVIKPNNQNIPNSKAFSYMEIDLTGETEAKELIVNASLYSATSGNFANVVINETNQILSSYDSSAFVALQSRSYDNTEYELGPVQYSKKLEPGKKYYVQFYYFRGSSDSVISKDGLYINNMKLIPYVDDINGTDIGFDDLVSPTSNGFTGDSYIYPSSYEHDTTYHSYIPVDLTGISEEKYLKINYDVYHKFGIVVNNSTQQPTVTQYSADYYKDDNNTSRGDCYVNLTPGEMNYVHFVAINDNNYTTYATIYSVKMFSGYTYNRFKDLKNSGTYGFDSIDYYNGDAIYPSHYGDTVAADSYVEIDLTNSSKDKLLRINANHYYADNYIYITNNRNNVKYTDATSSSKDDMSVIMLNTKYEYFSSNGYSMGSNYLDYDFVLKKGTKYYVHLASKSNSSGYGWKIKSINTYNIDSIDMSVGSNKISSPSIDVNVESSPIPTETDIFDRDDLKDLSLYKFTYDDITNEFVNENTNSLPNLAVSYTELDLTNSTKDKEYIFNYSISSNDNHYGFINIMEEDLAILDYSSDYSNNSYRNDTINDIVNNNIVKVSGVTSSSYHYTFTHGKKYYIQFAFYKNSSQEITSTIKNEFRIGIDEKEITEPVSSGTGIIREFSDNPDTVHLLKNINLEEKLLIDSDNNLILDLNGYTLSTLDNDYVIQNDGMLSIVDESYLTNKASAQSQYDSEYEAKIAAAETYTKDSYITNNSVVNYNSLNILENSTEGEDYNELIDSSSNHNNALLNLRYFSYNSATNSIDSIESPSANNSASKNNIEYEDEFTIEYVLKNRSSGVIYKDGLSSISLNTGTSNLIINGNTYFGNNVTTVTAYIYDIDYTVPHTIAFTYDKKALYIYFDGELANKRDISTSTLSVERLTKVQLPNIQTSTYAIRVYDKALNKNAIEHNSDVDNALFIHNIKHKTVNPTDIIGSVTNGLQTTSISNSEGAILTIENALINGNITSNGTLKIDNEGYVYGNVTSSGDNSDLLEGSGVINGNLNVTHNIHDDINGYTVIGDINANGIIDISNINESNGRVRGIGTINVDDSIINNLSLSGTYETNDSTVNGNLELESGSGTINDTDIMASVTNSGSTIMNRVNIYGKDSNGISSSGNIEATSESNLVINDSHIEAKINAIGSHENNNITGEIIIKYANIEINDSTINIVSDSTGFRTNRANVLLNDVNYEQSNLTCDSRTVLTSSSTNITYSKFTIDGGNYTINKLPNSDCTISTIIESINSDLKVLNNAVIGNTLNSAGILSNYSENIFDLESSLTLGNNEDSVSTTYPKITGNYMGVDMPIGSKFNFYDGIVKGSEAKAIRGTIYDLPDNYDITRNRESNYEEIYLKSNDSDDYVAQIGSTKYATLESAINSVTSSNETEIKILKDIVTARNLVIPTGKNIVIDHQNKSIDSYANNSTFTNNGTLKFTDSTNNVTSVNNLYGDVFVTNNGTFTYEKVYYVLKYSYTFTLSGSDFIKNKTLFVNSGIMNLNSGTIKLDLREDGGVGTSSDIQHNHLISNSGTLKLNSGNIIGNYTDSNSIPDSSYYLIKNDSTGNITLGSTNGHLIFTNSGTITGNDINVDAYFKNLDNSTLTLDNSTIERMYLEATDNSTSSILNSTSSSINYPLNLSGSANLNIENTVSTFNINNSGSGTVNVIDSDLYKITNTSTGTINVLGDTTIVDNSNNSIGINNSGSGTINLGEKDTNVSTSKPYIYGNRYGINNSASGTFNFYDGLVVGQTAINGLVGDVEEDYSIKLETIDNKEHKYLTTEPIVLNVTSGVEYNNFKRAFDSANSGDELRLLRNVSQILQTITIPANKTIIFDLNGNKVESSADTLFINNGTFTINDSDNTGIITSTHNSPLFINSASSVLTINGGNYNSSKNVITNNGTINITNGKFKSAGNYTYPITYPDGTVIRNAQSAIVSTTYSIENPVIFNEASLNISGGIFNSTITVNHGEAEISNVTTSSSVGFSTNVLELTSVTAASLYTYDSSNWSLNTSQVVIDSSNITDLEVYNASSVDVTSSQVGLTVGRPSKLPIIGAGHDGIDSSYVKLTNTTCTKVLIYNDSDVDFVSGSSPSFSIDSSSSGTINIGTKDGIGNDSSVVISTSRTVIPFENSSLNNTLNLYDFKIQYNLTPSSSNVSSIGNINELESGYVVFVDVDTTTNTIKMYPSNQGVLINERTTTKYSRLDTAFSEANSGDTIKLLNHFFTVAADQNITIPASKNITLDLAGHKLFNSNNGLFVNNGTLTFTDSAATLGNDGFYTSTGSIDDGNAGGLITNNGTLNIDKIYVNTTGSHDDQVMVMRNNGTVNISGTLQTMHYIDNFGTINTDEHTSIRSRILNEANSTLNMYKGLYVMSTYNGIDNYGTVTIEETDIERVINNYNEMTITNSNIHPTNYRVPAISNTSELTIIGGSITAPSRQFVENGTTKTTEGIKNTDELTIRSTELNNSTINSSGISSILVLENSTVTNKAASITVSGDLRITGGNYKAASLSTLLTFRGNEFEINGTTFDNEILTIRKGNALGVGTIDSNTFINTYIETSNGTSIDIKNTNITNNAAPSDHNSSIKVNNSTVNIDEDTTINNTAGYAISLSNNAVVNIGETGGGVSTTNPSIKGKTYAVYTENSKVNFYDGILIGETNGINNDFYELENGYTTVVGTQVIDDINYKTITLTPSGTVERVAVYNNVNYPTLQAAINACSTTTQSDITLYANIVLSEPLTVSDGKDIKVYLNGNTVTPNEYVTGHSGNGLIELVSGTPQGLGGAIYRFFANITGTEINPKDIIIYQMEDGSELVPETNYKLYKLIDDEYKLVKVDENEIGDYILGNDTSNLRTTTGQIKVYNIGEGTYKLVGSDGKEIEFNINENGISSNIRENKYGSKAKVTASAIATLILQLQTGIFRTPYFYIISIIILLIIGSYLLSNKKKKETE